jgi:hypothetical protein
MPKYPVLPSVSSCLSAVSRHVSHTHHPPSFHYSSVGMMRGSRCTMSCMHMAALPTPKEYSLRRSHWTVLGVGKAAQRLACRVAVLYSTLMRKPHQPQNGWNRRLVVQQARFYRPMISSSVITRRRLLFAAISKILDELSHLPKLPAIDRNISAPPRDSPYEGLAQRAGNSRRPALGSRNTSTIVAPAQLGWTRCCHRRREGGGCGQLQSCSAPSSTRMDNVLRNAEIHSPGSPYISRRGGRNTTRKTK